MTTNRVKGGAGDVALFRVLLLIAAVLLSTGRMGVQSTSDTGEQKSVRTATPDDVAKSLHSLDGYFIENRGQVAGGIRYYSTGNPSVGFRDDGIMFVLGGGGESKKETNGPMSVSQSFSTPVVAERATSRVFAYLVRFEGANKVTPVGRGELPFRSNFFLGSDPDKWLTDLPNYREVVYDDLYDGIDLIYRGGPDGVKYEFVVLPGSDPTAIRLAYDGVESARISEGGIVVSTPLGDITDSAPYSYQEGGREVECLFAARGGDTLGFNCGARDPSKSLIIDPLVYSTFIGGNDDNKWCSMETGDRGASIATDPAGNAYVYGGTCSPDFPVTPGAFNTTYWSGRGWGDGRQAFVAKLNPAGTMLVYATYLGGPELEIATSIAVDSAGNAYLTGATTSAGLRPGTDPFPTTPGAFDTTFDVFARNPEWIKSVKFTEAFVTKLNPQGNGLVYSTFLGGKMDEYAWSIAVDSAGNAYVAGETNGTDFPTTPGAYDRTFNSNYGTWDLTDIFVSKLSADGSTLVYSTYVGGSGYEWARSIGVDSSGNAYITGETNSTNFPVTAGAFDTSFNGCLDGFVAKLNAAGSDLAYSTYLGGDGWELSFSVAVDSAGSAYITGMTISTDFPITAGVFGWFLRGGRDAFVTKLNPDGGSLAYSTFLGGNSVIDAGLSIAVDSLGHAFVTGYTYSGDFPVTRDAFDTVFSDLEGFIAELNASGSGLLYSTFIGGRWANEQGSAIALDQMGIAYVTGWTNSSDFPTTPGAFSRTLDNFTDAFVVKLNPVTAADLADLVITPPGINFTPLSPVMIGTSVTITAIVRNIGGTNASNVVVRFFDGPQIPSNQIGTDQVIGTVTRFFGSGSASVVWPAAPVGTHSICVYVDPYNTITEQREDNNQACAPIEVVQPMPDLEVTSSDMVLSPPSPFVEGTNVQVSATIRNAGAAASGATVARFHDGMPPSPTIGTDQAVGPLAAGGSTTVSVTWRASPPRLHRICVVVDPDNLVVEINETNNQACVNGGVSPPPDLTPTSIATAPVSPLLEGNRTWVSVTVANIGDTLAGTFDVLLFYDSNGNRLPDVGENISLSSVSSLMGHSQTIVPFVWTASPAGTLSICAYADPPPGKVYERFESNNVVCTTIDVRSPITTRPDYVPDSPQPSTTLRVGTLLPVDLSLQVLNKGNDSATADATLAFYEDLPPAAPFARFVVPPLAASETSARFTATWTTPASPGTYHVSADVDYDGNVTEWNESDNVYTWMIEVVSGPMTSLVIGDPNYTSAVTYVNFSTPIDFSVRDQSGAGVLNTTYRIDGGQWVNYTATGRFFLTSEGEHTLEWYSVDFANNVEAVGSRVLRVDDSPPITSIHVSGPKYQSSLMYVNSLTVFNLTAFDGGLVPVGLALTEYRIGGGQWSTYTANFTLSGSDGQRVIEFRSGDSLGNGEAAASQIVFLDTTPPATTISPATGNATLDTLFTLAATDAGSGVQVTRYAVDGGTWRDYVAAFNLSQGYHNITYFSTDNLGNRETERSVEVNVTSTPPPSVEANYKPIVAVIFAIILLLAGVWSSRKKPWKGGKDGMPVVEAFVITSLPFVLAEAGTGILSFATDELRIPPFVGVGMAIDLTILFSGLAVALVRATRKTR